MWLLALLWYKVSHLMILQEEILIRTLDFCLSRLRLDISCDDGRPWTKSILREQNRNTEVKQTLVRD
jgi:hypothetical protein